MRIWSRILICSLFAIAVSCGGERKVATPLETFQTYVKAIKLKDTTAMKILLSDSTVKMHEKEAKSLGITVDEVVKRQTLFGENQKTVEYRNEKIDGQTATIEVKNVGGGWETVPFVFEDGAWKIDKAGAAEKMMRDIETEQKDIFDNLRDPNSATPIQ